MKYIFPLFLILTWHVEWTEIVGCPNNEPRINPYTGQLVFPSFQTSQLCFDNFKKEMSQEFETMEEIEEFKKGCVNKDPNSIIFISGEQRCSDWKVEGTGK